VISRGRGWLLTLLAPLCLPAPAASLPEQVSFCETCHGKGGNSTVAGTPSIGAQPVTFLENQLVFFREGLRNAPVMEPIAKKMTDAEITALARHFAAQPARSLAGPADPALTARGKQLAETMHCGQCHLPRYEGRAQMPRLAGQREDYMIDAMIGYRDGKRTGADTTMSEVLYGMNDADIKALAHYLARQ
jgi:cytochrome c553